MNIKIIVPGILIAAALLAPRAVIAADAPESLPEASTRTASGEIVFPPLPERARIRFVRSIRTMRDLKGGKESGFTKFLSALAGGDADLPLVARPYGVWKQGDKLYITDTTASAALSLDLKKMTLTDIGNKGEGRLKAPIGITADAAGNIYIADSGDSKVKAYSSKGEFLWQNGDLGETGGKLNHPGGIALTPGGELLVLDTGNKRAVVLTTAGKFVRQMCRNMKDPYALATPANVWVEKNGNFIISDPLLTRIHVFTSTGGYVSGFGEQGDSAGYLARPRGIATDSVGNIYVADAIFNRIQIFNRKGELLLYFGSPGQGPGELTLPAGMFIDADDMIYVVDSKNQRVQIYQYIKYPDEQPTDAPSTAGEAK